MGLAGKWNNCARNLPIRQAGAVGLIFLGVIQSGCTTAAKYKMQGATVPPVAYNLKAENDALSANLRTVILYHGPGSWKQEALWDEYFLTLTNRSSGAMSVTDAQLYDLNDTPQAPGEDPWELEKQSKEHWKHYLDQGFSLAMGLTTAVVTAGGLGAYVLAGSATAGAALVALPVLVAGEIVVVQVLDSKNRKAITKEFQYRRLSLPAVIGPTGDLSGSLFFPQTPGPRKLILEYEAAHGPASLEICLVDTPVGAAHLKQEGSKR